MNRKQRRAAGRAGDRGGPTRPAAPASVADLLLAQAGLAPVAAAVAADPAAAPTPDPVAAAFAATKRAAAQEAALAEARRRAEAAGEDIAAWLRYGQLALRADRRDAARAAFRRCAAIDPAREEVAHLLAALGDGPAPARASDAYVANVFDGMAERFDDTLVTFLDYRAPEILAGLAARLLDGRRQLDIADLGCGTGLMAPHLRPWARRLVGVDLSAGMLARAQARGLYDALEQAELGAWLRRQPARFDLAAAADVFCYFGAIDEPLAAARAAIRPGGLLVFTVERQDGADWTLRESGRYAHGRGYLEEAARRTGWTLRALEAAQLRMEHGTPVAGFALALTAGEAPHG